MANDDFELQKVNDLYQRVLSGDCMTEGEKSVIGNIYEWLGMQIANGTIEEVEPFKKFRIVKPEIFYTVIDFHEIVNLYNNRELLGSETDAVIGDSDIATIYALENSGIYGWLQSEINRGYLGEKEPFQQFYILEPSRYDVVLSHDSDYDHMMSDLSAEEDCVLFASEPSESSPIDSLQSEESVTDSAVETEIPEVDSSDIQIPVDSDLADSLLAAVETLTEEENIPISTNLEAENMPVSELPDISETQMMTNLEMADLPVSELPDISKTQVLTNLETEDLPVSELPDISAIEDSSTVTETLEPSIAELADIAEFTEAAVSEEIPLEAEAAPEAETTPSSERPA